MRSIACKYAGAARNLLRGGVLKNHRVIYGRQFEIDPEDDVLVSVPSTDLFIDVNKKLLGDPSMFNYVKTSMICGDEYVCEKFPPENYSGNEIIEEPKPPIPEGFPSKYPEEKPTRQDSEETKKLSNRVHDILVCPDNLKLKTDFERRLI